MTPMGRMDDERRWREGWGLGEQASGHFGEYAWPGSSLYELRYGYGYGGHERPFPRYRERLGGEHVWRGGMLGWLGSGLRAGAAWIGDQLQGWGSLLGGKLKGGSAELARAMAGRGEEMGSALEERGEQVMTRRPEQFRGRPARSYRRPDERILDDVHQRVSMAPIDASEIEIEVSNGVVKLSGRVPRRFDKRVLEEIAENVFGVEEVQNHLRLARGMEEAGAGGEGATIVGANGQPAFSHGTPPRA